MNTFTGFIRYSNFFHRWVSVAVSFFIVIIANSSFAYDLEKQVVKYTLGNGLKVLIVERHFSPTVSLYIRHKVGAVDEQSGKTGTAHFLEHMLFKGTRTIGSKDPIKEERILDELDRTGQALDQERLKEKEADQTKIKQLQSRLETLQKDHDKLFISNEIDRLYTENGADQLNASTGQDVTTYQVNLPANKLELWARIESERMIYPVFREFYAERDVIMEERRQSVESDPDGKLLEQFLAAAFVAHPYRRPILGWPSDMAYLSMKDLDQFLKKYHTPANTVIAVVGDVESQKAIHIIKKYFGAISPGIVPVAPVTREPVQLGERRIRVNAEANPRLIIGYHKPAPPAYEDYVFDVIQGLLTEGRTSRLYKSLVEDKALAENVSSMNGMPGNRYDNLFTIYVSPRNSHSVMELETALNMELENLKINPVPQRELSRVKNRIKADFIRNLDSNAELASMLSYYETIMGDYRYIIKTLQIIDKITSNDILRVAQKYFIEDNKTLAFVYTKAGM